MNNVTGNAIRQTTGQGKLVAWACRYDPFRSALLDALRRQKGPRYEETVSLIVSDALDELLKKEGLLPEDAPLLSTVPLDRRRKERQTA